MVESHERIPWKSPLPSLLLGPFSVPRGEEKEKEKEVHSIRGTIFLPENIWGKAMPRA